MIKIDSTSEEPTPEQRLKGLEKRRQLLETEAKQRLEGSTGVFERPEVVRREVFGATTKVELVEFYGAMGCEGANFVCGLPGNGLTALLSAGYLTKQLDLPVVGHLRVHGSKPGAAVKDNCPGQTIRLVGNSKLVCLLAENPIKGGGLTYNLIQAVLSFCRRRRVAHLFTLDTVPTKPTDLEDAARLRFLTSCPKFGEYMKGGNHLAILDAIIPGVAGQLVADAAVAEGLRGMEISCILAKAAAGLPSAQPAVHVTKALDGFLDNFEIDLTDLEDSALEMENAVKEAVRQAQAAQRSPRDAPSSMYM